MELSAILKVETIWVYHNDHVKFDSTHDEILKIYSVRRWFGVVTVT